jgi:hypothetical protein
MNSAYGGTFNAIVLLFDGAVFTTLVPAVQTGN